MSYINDAVEAAFVTYITTVTGGAMGGQVKVFSGKDSQTKSVPCVICACDGASMEEDPKWSGNFWVEVSIFVKSPASIDIDAFGNAVDPKPSDLALANQVFNALQITDLDTKLNGASLTVFPTAWMYSSPKCGTDSHGVWISELPMRLYCCGAQLN